MKIKGLKLKLIFIALLPVALLFREYLSYNNLAAENLYSRLIYPPIGRSLSLMTGIFSFSVAELLLYAFIFLILFLVVRFVFRVIKAHKKLQEIIKGVVNALSIFSIVYCLFLLLWGFNYYRQPLAYSLGYNIEKSTVADLKNLCADLIDKTNQLRSQVPENSNGIMYIKDGLKGAMSRAPQGYANISPRYPVLSGHYGRPKGVIASRELSYTGIAGIYMPFTGEANVNTIVPDSMLPSTIAHEMAHQRGFAREDEANFIAYLTCKAHGDSDFQYSGYMLALIYSMNALHNYDAAAYKELAATYSPGVVRDLNFISDFWKQFEGPAERVQEKVNDAYLKSNKQADGIYSYGRMVDLLLAEYKTSNKK